MKRVDNFSTFKQLREEYKFFSYERYSWYFDGNQLKIQYIFNLSDKYFFTPEIKIPYKPNLYRTIDSMSRQVLDVLVFHTGMIELISYWKAACPKQVLIKSGGLTPDQVSFWKKIYFQGLGEFFYLNSINTDEDDFIELIAENSDSPELIKPGLKAGSVVPVGGGKDSAVTLDLMNKAGMDWIPMVVNPGYTIANVLSTAGKGRDDTADIHREIHPLLLRLNQEGFLNGHTPFSALLAFYSLLSAYLSGRQDILLSNESSASEATVPGTSINHQYSKSHEFENDFRNYVKTNISEEFNYFSFLRPLSELQIAGLFSKMEQFHPHFRSCNVGSKTGAWCGHCPKCLFTFIILSPFLEPEKLESIFGKNLLEDHTLEDIMHELTGVRAIKPFECIGTVDEVNLALQQSVKRYDGKNLPALLKKYLENAGNIFYREDDFEQILAKTSDDHFVPGKYFNLLIQALK